MRRIEVAFALVLLTLVAVAPRAAVALPRVLSELPAQWAALDLRYTARPVVVTDLDETVLDSTLRRYASYQDVFATLCGAQPAQDKKRLCQLGRGLNISELLAQSNRYDSFPLFAGLGLVSTREELAALDTEMLKHYLSGEHMTLDQPVPGAAEFMASLIEAGAKVFYVSSRFEDVQGAGSREVLARLGMMGPSQGAGLDPEVLLRKRGQSSIDFKREAFARTLDWAKAHQGEVKLAMENEPENMNAMTELFPSAQRVFVLGAILKPEPLKKLEDLVQVRDFR